MQLRPIVHALLTAMMLVGVGHAASAQERHGHDAAQPRHGAGLQLDQRYHHDHYYPPRGYAMAALPVGAISVAWRGAPYYFHGGVWWRPHGPRFIVAVPPLGIIVPILPPAYVSLWIGGAPYYYANGVYYAPDSGGYVVVTPPPGADSVQPAPTPKPLPDPIIYPRNGQSAEQTEADRQDCNRWATTQPSAMSDASVFQRAVAACMDGRGYTVR
jgi:hypothetical protein